MFISIKTKKQNKPIKMCGVVYGVGSVNNRKCQQWFDTFPGGGNEKDWKYQKLFVMISGGVIS